MAQTVATKRERRAAVPAAPQLKESRADDEKNTPQPKARRRPQGGRSGARSLLKASVFLQGQRMLAQAMSSVADAPAEPATQSGEDVAAADFKRMYSLLVHAVPEEVRLSLVEKLKQGLSSVEQEVRAELPRTKPGKRSAHVSTTDFVAQLRRDEQEYREEQVASKELLSSAEMRARLQVTPQALSAAVKAKRMFTLPGPSGAQFFPAFFADRTYDRPVLERVSKALGNLPGGSKYFFFTTQRYSLGGKSPLQVLAKGKIDDVLDAAEAFVEE